MFELWYVAAEYTRRGTNSALATRIVVTLDSLAYLVAEAGVVAHRPVTVAFVLQHAVARAPALVTELERHVGDTPHGAVLEARLEQRSEGAAARHAKSGSRHALAKNVESFGPED